MKNEPIFRRVTLHFAKHSKVEEHGENFAYFLSDHFVKGKVVRPLICEERESAHIINLLLLVEMDNNVKAAGLRSSTKASYTWMTREVMFRDFGLRTTDLHLSFSFRIMWIFLYGLATLWVFLKLQTSSQ